MKIGLVGCGPWAQNYIETLERNHAEIEVVRFSVRGAKTTATNPDSTIFLAHTILDQIMHRKLDGVILATTPQIQFNIAPELIKLNIPVSLEKPIALTLNELKLLTESMNPNSIIYVNFPTLFDDNIAQYVTKLSKDDDAEIAFIVNGGYGPFRHYMRPFDDWAPHVFSIATEAFGSIKVDKSIIRSIHNVRGSIFISDLVHLNDRRSRLIFGNGLKRRRRIYRSSSPRRPSQHDYLPNSDSNIYYMRGMNALEQPLDRLVQMFIADINSQTMSSSHILHKILKITAQYLTLKEQSLSAIAKV